MEPLEPIRETLNERRYYPEGYLRIYRRASGLLFLPDVPVTLHPLGLN